MRYAIQRIYRCLLPALLVCCFLLPQAVFAATIPQAGSAAAREMDRQVAARLGQNKAPAEGLSLSITTPVDITDLERTNTLSLQMQEEIARWFVQAGYTVQEIRKGRDVLFSPKKGETLLTRESRLLGSRSVSSTALIAGTYTVASDHIRFNIRMICTRTRAVLAMSTVTLPKNRDTIALLRSSGGSRASAAGGSGSIAGYYEERSQISGVPIEPTVVTLLP